MVRYFFSVLKTVITVIVIVSSIFEAKWKVEASFALNNIHSF